MNIKHFNNLALTDVVYNIKQGDYFTYLADNKEYYRVGLKISPSIMIPVGLTCKTKESAQKQAEQYFMQQSAKKF